MKPLNHVTLNSGHARRSPRSEFPDDIVARLRHNVEMKSSAFVWLGPLLIEIEGDTFTLAYEPGRPAVRCVLSRDGGAAAWASAIALAAAAEVCTDLAQPEAPWLAVIVLPDAPLDDPERLQILDDTEHCLAWAMLERH